MTGLGVLHVDPERGFSGGETQVLALALHLRDAGHRSTLAVHPGGELERRALDRDLEVHPLACPRSHDPGAGLALRRLVRRLRPDVVHLHTARALSLAAYLPRTPVRVVTRRMDYPPRGAAAYVRWLYARVDAVIAISAPVRDALLSRGIPAAAVTVVHSGVDVERFRCGGAAPRSAARAGFGLGPLEPVVAIVASLHARKGHAVLLEALAVLEARGLRVHLLVAGDGPEGPGLGALARERGLADRVRWLGRVDDVRPVLAAADVVALPSLAEGLGVAAIEAMAARRPLVASAVGGLAELLTDGVDGLLVPPGDPGALAGALGRCLADPGLREALAAAAERRAGGLSTAAMARGTEAVYERELARRRAGRTPADARFP